MADGGWTLGLLTWAAILGGAALFAFAAIRADHRLPRRQEPPPPKVDYRESAERQSREAWQRSQRHSLDPEITEADWLHHAATRLREHWPEVEYDVARRWMREYLVACGMVFPDPSYEWTRRSAREFADEYMREVGEGNSNA